MSQMEADDNIPSTSSGRTLQEPATSKSNALTAAEIKQRWNFAKVIRRLGTTEQCVQFAEDNGLILRSKLCTKHKTQMSLHMRGNCSLGIFRCRKSSCRANSGVSRASGTWFEKAKISLPHIFHIMYGYAHHWSNAMTREENFVEGSCLSNETITDWYSYCREAVVTYQVDKQESKGKIGGPGKIVQIDESKFGKRKYNKGRRVEGHWVLGMIENGSEVLRLEVCPDNVRLAEVLIPLIKKPVTEGTTIHTDYWKAYDCLRDHGYEHLKVNHSDPDNPFVTSDGIHTQRIESQWRVVKRFFQKDNYNNPSNFADIIVEYIWRKSIIKNRYDPFEKLIDVIKYSYKP
ncbi:uncharacterized protein LOC129242210 [Anastrepha obliqua]|uniref:uncharacterized protein LOC129242210 n=1 Tax=Anastrepha obliqua TaxID=95512 RepID=UPI002409B061|nr:uncharacterized protein LOC129242210 [Anastrepha obliqua]